MDIITSISQLLIEVIRDEENREILQTDLRPMENLLLDIASLFQEQRKEAQEAIKIWMQLLHNSFTQAKTLLQRPDLGQRQRCLDCLMCKPGRLFKEIKEWKVLFDSLFQGLQSDFSIFLSAQQIVNRDPIPAMSAEESLQQLSKDEAWMLFRKIAFKDNPVPMDLEECAKNIADECKGFRLAITLVAAAMREKGRVDEWETSLSSIKNADFSSPDTLHPEFYQLLRWSFDALPNSDVKNCFLYCAMYPKDENINVQELVQMWVSEGLVRSKEENHLMDMAIGRSYLNLLVDRCFFQNATDDEEIIIFWEFQRKQCIRVHHVIREMAIYIGEEENCLFKAGQGLQNFPMTHNENCKRISVGNNDIKNLPTEFPCATLVSLILSLHNSIEEVPSGFLISLTSLKVLHLHSSGINSIPSSVGQLKQLEFLSLRNLRNIQGLPEEICHLSALQFLDLQDCQNLQSLPSEIDELKNLKYLSLFGCNGLKGIPPEISQLTSLSTIDLYGVTLSLQAELSIWRLKGLRNLRMLRIRVEVDVQEGMTPSGIKEGIMGTWLEMRHFSLVFDDYGIRDDVMEDLPHDMQNMRKLQSFAMGGYHQSSLPDYTCKFQHLENITFFRCHHLRGLSPLERLPNLRYLTLADCNGLKELGIGTSGQASGFLMLEKLILGVLLNSESIAAASKKVVWNGSTLTTLRILTIGGCPKLKILHGGMDTLLNLSIMVGQEVGGNK